MEGAITTDIRRWNDVQHYTHIGTYFGYNDSNLPEDAVFSLEDNEAVYELVVPYDATPMEKVVSILDETDYAILEETARSKYLTTLQEFQYLTLRGYEVSRIGVRNRIRKLIKYRILREYEIRRKGAARGIRFHELDYRGYQIAMQRGVSFHKGNCFLSESKKQELGLVESAESVKRVLAANMVILGLLKNAAAIEGFGFNETIRPLQEGPVTDNCILRTQGMFWMEEGSVFLVEVVRSSAHAFRKLADKVNRYYALVNNANYLEGNVHGHTAFPQLILCAENLEHARKIDAYLRSRDLWRDEDTILYTHDLLYMQNSLNTLYELKEDGTQIWYRLPSRSA